MPKLEPAEHVYASILMSLAVPLSPTRSHQPGFWNNSMLMGIMPKDSTVTL
jgi:hypothetical protein